MNETRSLIKGLLAAAVVSGITVSVMADMAAMRVAKVIRVNGPAHYSVDGGATFRTLTVGTTLKPGSQITTAKEKGAYVDVVLGDGRNPIPGFAMSPIGPGGGGGGGVHTSAGDTDVVRLIGSDTSATTLAFDKLAAIDTGEVLVTETELNLKSGRIVGNVKKMSAGSSYNIRYATGQVTIRGSVYDLAIVEGLVNGQVKVDVVVNMQTGSASVAFKDSQGNTLSQVVLPLQSFNTGTGVLSPIPAGLLTEIGDLLAAMGVPPVLVTRIVSSDQTIIQFLTDTGAGNPGHQTAR